MLPNIIKSILVLFLEIKPHAGKGNLFNILVFWTRNMAQTALYPKLYPVMSDCRVKEHRGGGSDERGYRSSEPLGRLSTRLGHQKVTASSTYIWCIFPGQNINKPSVCFVCFLWMGPRRSVGPYIACH